MASSTTKTNIVGLFRPKAPSGPSSSCVALTLQYSELSSKNALKAHNGRWTFYRIKQDDTTAPRIMWNCGVDLIQLCDNIGMIPSFIGELRLGWLRSLYLQNRIRIKYGNEL